MTTADKNRTPTALDYFKVAGKGLTAFALNVVGNAFCLSVVYEGFTGEKSTGLFEDFIANHHQIGSVLRHSLDDTSLVFRAIMGPALLRISWMVNKLI